MASPLGSMLLKLATPLLPSRKKPLKIAMSSPETEICLPGIICTTSWKS